MTETALKKPRRKLTLKDKSAALDARIARAHELAARLIAQREALIGRVRAEAQAKLDEAEAIS